VCKGRHFSQEERKSEIQLMSSEVGSSRSFIEGRRDKRAGGILWVLTPSRLLVRSYRREC
jgi:hypothetical protein